MQLEKIRHIRPGGTPRKTQGNGVRWRANYPIGTMPRLVLPSVIHIPAQFLLPKTPPMIDRIRILAVMLLLPCSLPRPCRRADRLVPRRKMGRDDALPGSTAQLRRWGRIDGRRLGRPKSTPSTSKDSPANSPRPKRSTACSRLDRTQATIARPMRRTTGSSVSVPASVRSAI